MSRSRVVAAAVAGSALLGGTIYAMRDKKTLSPGDMKRNKAERARDLGLGGAGVGGNFVTGGPEASSDPSRPEHNSTQSVKTTAKSPDQLPSGAIGGGEGAGGSSARRTEIPFSGSTSSSDSRSYQGSSEQKKESGTGSSEKAGWLGSLTTSLRAGAGGGSKSNASRDDEAGLHNTKGISQMGNEVPSKKTAPASN